MEFLATPLPPFKAAYRDAQHCKHGAADFLIMCKKDAFSLLFSPIPINGFGARTFPNLPKLAELAQTQKP